MYKLNIDYIVKNKIENLSEKEKNQIYNTLSILEKNGIENSNVHKLKGLNNNSYIYRVSTSIRLIFEMLEMEIRIVDIVFRDTIDYFKNSFKGDSK